MAFTRQHYKAIAEVIKRHCDLQTIDDATDETILDIVSDLSDYFASDNERFDRGRFMKACGIE